MLKTLITFILSLSVFFFFFASKSLAVTVTITNYPSTITEEAFTISASVTGASAGTNYLKVDIYKDQTTNYFGETFNSTDFYSGSTYNQYLPITIQSGVVWTGDIQARVGSPTTTQYDWTGTYKIRLRRYTSGGGYTSSEANNSAVTVTINLPVPTPTPSPTPSPSPSPSPTPSPTPTSSTIISSPTPSPKASPVASPKKSPTPSPDVLDEDISLTEADTQESLVLGINQMTSEPEATSSAESSISAVSSLFSKFNPLAILMIVSGAGLLGFSAYSFFGKGLSGKIESNAHED